MIRWMQTNGKYLMAVFGVMLMLVYIRPSNFGNSRGNDIIRGHMGKLAISESDLQRYRKEWEYLNRYALTPRTADVPADQLPPTIRRLLGPEAYTQIRIHPDMYGLLVEEALQMGVSVSRDQLENILTSEIRTPDQTGTDVVKPAESTDPDRMENLRACLADFLLVQNAFARAASSIKVSQPLDKHMLATREQEITLNLVEFPAAPYLAKVPPPTPVEMQKQFDRYANIDSASANLRSDPFNFGYRYPNRIKLQYISVPRDSVIAAARAARNSTDQTRYDWDIAAYRYYQANQSLYATTQPQNALSLSPQQSTSKTIKPFKQINDQARQAVLQDDTDKLALAIRQRIISQMATDFMAWKNAGTSAPAPPTSVGVAYDSPEYLNRLALLIQKDYGVLPTVVSPGGWQTLITLDSLSGISAASIDDPDMRPLRFAEYAMAYYSAFVIADQPDASNALSAYEPSAPLKDDNDDFYLFRITAGQTSHAPANVAEVAEQVRTDLQKAAAYQRAGADAEKFLRTARGEQSISSAAHQGGQTLLVAGPIQYNQTNPVAGYATLSQFALHEFIPGAFDLLALASRADLHPIGLIPVQVQDRAVVAQVSNISPLWSSAVTLPVLQSLVGASIRQEFAANLQTHWFNYDDLVARTDYQEAKLPNPTNSPAPPPSQPNPPPL